MSDEVRVPRLEREEINAFRQMMKGPNPDPSSVIIQKIDMLCDMALAAAPTDQDKEDAETLRSVNEAAAHLERRLNWLEDTFRHCPHTVIRHNNDPDEEDERGPVPLGWSIWIAGCAPLHIRADTFPDLVEAAMAWENNGEDELIDAALKSSSTKEKAVHQDEVARCNHWPGQKRCDVCGMTPQKEKAVHVASDSTCSSAGVGAGEERRYLRGFIAAMVVLTKEEPSYGEIPGLRAFVGAHDAVFSETESMREVLLQAIGNAEALEALATGSDLGEPE